MLVLARSVLVLAAVAATAGIATAHAQEPDPHMPNGATLWCPGGMGNVALIPYCEGVRYPDGSFWRQEAASPFAFGGPGALPWKPPVLITP